MGCRVGFRVRLDLGLSVEPYQAITSYNHLRDPRTRYVCMHVYVYVCVCVPNDLDSTYVCNLLHIVN